MVVRHTHTHTPYARGNVTDEMSNVFDNHIQTQNPSTFYFVKVITLWATNPFEYMQGFLASQYTTPIFDTHLTIALLAVVCLLRCH